MSLSKDDLADIRTLIVEGTTEALNAVVNPRFDRIEQRLDSHDEQFKKIEKRFDEIDKRFDKVERHLTDHDQRFNQVDHKLDSIEHRLSKLEGSVEALENDVKALYGMVPVSADTSREKATPEQRLREMFASMQALARELNIEL